MRRPPFEWLDAMPSEITAWVDDAIAKHTSWVDEGTTHDTRSDSDEVDAQVLAFPTSSAAARATPPCDQPVINADISAGRDR